MAAKKRALLLFALAAIFAGADAFASIPRSSLPDSKRITALGVPTKYTDQVSQDTTVTDKDLIGRPVRREYADGTFEHFAWEGPRISTYTNRQGQTLTYTYYPTTGKLFQIIGSVVLDEFRYDAAGRVSMMRTPDAEIDIDSYDNEGHPLHVKETRLINGTPSSALEQTYTWNAHGERTSWTMPRFGTPQTGWTDTVFEDHDEAGNVIGISRTQFGSGTSAPSVLLGAGFRNAGRPDQRTVTTSCAGVQVCTGGSILRKYDYNANAQMNSLTVTGSGGALAGSVANYEANGLQIHDVKILGLAGGAHYNVYGYDDRSRLQGAVLNTTDPNAAPAGSAPGTVGMNYTNPDGNADFLGGITRVPRLDAATRSALTAQGVDVNRIDPSGTTATPTSGGHKIATFGPIGGTARTFGYTGSLVSDDGKYAYSWNEKEQLVAVTQKPTTTAFPIRRFRYYYDGRGRVVGRRAQSANVVSLSDNLDTLPWQTETNPSLLAADGLPADTTFAWDMVSDQLIAVFNTNPQPSDPNAGLMRQIIHGGLTYDDPIEVTMPAGDLSGKLNRLYPIFDEAAAGSLQAVLNADAQLVARNLPDDPAGAEDVSFAGATIDHASIHATKDSSGNLQSIDVTIHATEPLESATLATGLRLASVNTNGVAVKTFTGAAQAVSGDAYSAKFTLSPTDWVTLNDPAAQALSIGVTPTLRAHGWASGLPILPPTEWAQLNGVFTTPALPVEIRDSLSSISTFVAAIGNSSQNTTTIYDVPSVALIGSTGDGTDAASTLFTAKFQALPFSDPATGLVYARARWYSPETGTFLSGDPLAYKDSSNLYAFAAGDPVNGRDPTGEEASVGTTGTIVATRKDGSIRRISPQEVAANPNGIRAFLMTESNLYWRDAYNLVNRVERMLGTTSTSPGIQAARRGANIAAPGVNATATGLSVMASFTGVGAAAQLTQSFMEHGATKTNVAIAGMTALHLGAVDELATLGNLANETREMEAVATHCALRLDSGEEQARVVIGRTKDLRNLEEGEESLLSRLPNRGGPKANWKQNAGVLRQAMKRGLPIRDASPLDNDGIFLNAERNLLASRGWKFDRITSLWMPPTP